MSILFHNKGQIVQLSNDTISYVMEVVDGKYLVHRYFGRKIRNYRGTGKSLYFKRGYNTEHDSSVENVSFDDFPFEYPVGGYGDFRIPAFALTQEDGITFCEPVFKSWSILGEKPEISGMPQIRTGKGESETLEVICEDDRAGIRLFLYYTIFENHGIILRHQKVENYGKQTIFLQNIQSMSLELPAEEYELLTLYGTHAKEANIQRFPLHYGIQKTESVRGSSSPQHQPFFAVLKPDTKEQSGEVWGAHLIYSGNFLAQTEKDQFGNVRAQIGIHPDTFCWELKPGTIFESPEVVLNYSNDGLNGMRRNFHWLYQYHLIPKRFEKKARPILLNSWESMYYDVTLEKIDEQADLAKAAGIELFVLDDGWFRKGNDSRSSMGDWKCNEQKLPGGITAVADLIHKKGLQFGLWFEPEAISEESDLYRQHPEWTLHIPGYPSVKGRHEFLLDLSREDVCEYLFQVLDFYLKDGKINYVKWDMNRPLTEVNSVLLGVRQKAEVGHRYVLGLYNILERITEKYPEVIIEGCSSGGARFDPGMLYYVPQNWTSDNTDAFDRAVIQRGYSLLYPQITMGAHVSIVPNHQTGRSTSLDARYQVAKLFNLGYELDLTKCTKEERTEIAEQIAEYKTQRAWLQQGKLSYHEVPNENYIAWSVTSEQEEECLLVIMQKLFDPRYSHGRIRFLNLNPEWDYKEEETGEIFGGDELMQIGVSVPLVKQDFHTFSFHFSKVEGEKD